MLKAIFFGVPQIYYNHDALTGALSGRCLALFAYLALTNQPQDRGILADLLWSEIGEQQARQNLRYVLYDLRKIVGDYLIVTRNTIAFDRQKAHWIDANIFADYLATKETVAEPALLQDLLHLYQDELLAGFVIQNAPGFEEWLTQQRHIFRQQATKALLRLSNHYLSQGEYSAGLVVTQRLLQLEPWQEETHRNQMCLLVFSGQRLADNEHRSCLLLISRITPTVWEALARRSSAVRTLALTGLSADASVALLQAGGRTVTAPLRTLAEQCVGHPQSLVTMRDLLDSFGIDLLTEPLTEPTLAGSALRILQAQFARLAPIEQSILHQVTLLLTSPTAATLWQQIPHTVTLVAYLEALHTLQRQHWLLPRHAGAPLLLSPLVRRFLEQSSPHTPSQKSSAVVKPQPDDGGQARLPRPLALDDERLRHLEGQKRRKAEVAPSLYAPRSVPGSDVRAY